MFYNYEEFKKLINNMGSQNTKKIYVVIGNPIGHSISPFLHSIINKDCKYFALLLNSLQLQDFCAFAKNNLQGFNVTVPCKKEIIK